MREIAAELNAYIGTHDEGIQESVPNAFQGQFNPILPTGCQIAEMYGENPDLTQTRYITVVVKYRASNFGYGTH